MQVTASRRGRGVERWRSATGAAALRRTLAEVHPVGRSLGCANVRRGISSAESGPGRERVFCFGGILFLVERDDCLHALDELLAECSRGNGSVALVSGGLATGKTELLDHFAERAAGQGALVLRATGSKAEQALPMGAMSQLFQDAALPAGPVERVEEIVAAAARSPAAGEPAEDTGRHTAQEARDLCALLLELAAERPVVIGIDDVHFVDNASLHTLLYLQRRVRSARILLVLNEWTRPRMAQPFFHAETTRQPHHRIRLDRLSRTGVHDLFAHSLGEHTAGRLASSAYLLTGGNPMLVNALIEDCERRADHDPDDGSARITPGVCFDQAVHSILHRWEPALLEVAQGQAVLGEHASPALIARLLGVMPERAAEMQDILGTAGLLGPSGFPEPVAAAVLGTLDAEERSQLHSLCAELLHKLGSSTAEIAVHLLAADRASGRWAMEVLRDAAAQALAGNDAEHAAACLELALDACTHDAERLTITAMLARAAWRVNPAAILPHLDTLREAVREGSLNGRDVVNVIRYLLWQGDIEGAGEIMNDPAVMDDLADAQHTAELSLILLAMRGPSHHPLPRGAEPATPGAPEIGGPFGNPWARATATLTDVLQRESPEAAVMSAEYILQSCRLSDTTLEITAFALLALQFSGRPDLAALWCDGLIEEAVRRRANTWQAVLGSVRAEIALRQGDLAIAEAKAEAAFSRLQPKGWGVLIGLPISTLVMVHTALNRPERAAELLTLLVPEAMFDTSFGLLYLRARGHHHLAGDRALAALSDFQSCGTKLRDWNADVPTLMPWRTDLAEVYLKLARPDVTRDLVDRQLELPGSQNGVVRGVSLRVKAAAGELGQRPRLLKKAIELLQDSGNRLELVRALADLSAAYQALGDFARARTSGRRAVQEAKLCYAGAVPAQLLRGLPGEVVVAEREKKEEPAPAKGDTSTALSDAERRVATLAAVGHTNREIGNKLYITVSTVEQHLTRIYRKLQVSSRDELLEGLRLRREPEDLLDDHDGGELAAEREF
ncbi:AAA family ATPase [Streptomyces filamentosus]|uniref:helix-turn-helix transcriptional regulator n=1 Tax=Streptomyces filamentosus TaxID=67294 RepID=UPI001E653785|nr:LuxR family transcriptional regulator [Streptomyces filamentosus]